MPGYDNRELILARLATILESVPGVRTFKRNEYEIDESQLPTILLIDGDEETEEEFLSHSRMATNPRHIVVMLPEIYAISTSTWSQEGIGTKINTLRQRVIREVMNDAELRGLLWDEDVRYLGAQTGLEFGNSAHGGVAVQFAFRYIVDPRAIPEEEPTEEVTEPEPPTELATEVETEEGEATEEATGTEEATELPTEEGTEPSTELPTELPTEPSTELPTEPSTELPTEPETELPTEPETEIETELPTEPGTEVPTEAEGTEEATEEASEAPTEEATEEGTEPSTEGVTELPSEEGTEPSTELPTEEATEEETELPTEAGTEEATEEPTELPTEAATEEETEEPDPDATAIIEEMTEPPEPGREALIRSTVAALKSAGLWEPLDCLYMMAAHDEQAARINWKLPGAFTLSGVNNPTFTEDVGFQSNGTTSYLNSGFAPATHADQMLADNASVFVRMTSEAATAGFPRAIGASGASAAGMTQIIVRDVDSGTAASINGGASTSAAATENGLTAIRRTASNAKKLFKNGVALNGNNDNSANTTALPPVPYFLCCWNNNGTPAGFETRPLGAAGWGAALDDSQMAALHTIISNYLAGL